MKLLFLGKMPRSTAAVSYDHTVIEQRIMKQLSPGTEVVCDFPDDYDGSLAERVLGRQNMLNGIDHVMVTPSLLRKIVWAEENGFDAVVQSNPFDPGVEAQFSNCILCVFLKCTTFWTSGPENFDFHFAVPPGNSHGA